MSLLFDLSWRKENFSLVLKGETSHGLIGVFGPSGAGKSTFLNLIAGTERPDEGVLSIDGEVLFDSAKNIHVPVHKRKVAVVFQDGRLFPHLKVDENLRFGMSQDPGISFERMIALLALEPLLEKRPWQLSGGERQRVALGRALLSAPRYLLLDEPLAALDRGLKRRILPYLKEVLRETGIPAIYVSHDLTEILQLTNTLMVMDRGRQVARGSFLDLVRHPGALALFHDLGLPNVIRLRVVRHVPEEGITCFAPASAKNATWIGPLLFRETGDEIQVMVRPEDIALSLDRVARISVRNQVCGCIVEMIQQGSRTLCIVDVGIELLVDLTPDAIHGLKLEKGQEVWCIFKAHALRYQ